jgi:hypothetical protein
MSRTRSSSSSCSSSSGARGGRGGGAKIWGSRGSGCYKPVLRLLAFILVDSAYEQHAKKADDGFRSAKDQALKQLQVTGGKQLLKRQLQSLKSSLQNLGQKESFSEGRSQAAGAP